MTTPVVIDASVAGSWVLPDETTVLLERLFDSVLRGELLLVVPELWGYEMLNVLRSAVVRKRLAHGDAVQALRLLQTLPVETVPLAAQGEPGILAMAFEHGLSAYDATYVHLAQWRGIDLVVADYDVLKLRASFPWIWSVEEFCAANLPNDARGS